MTGRHLRHHHPDHKPHRHAGTADNDVPVPGGEPRFAQPEITPGEKKYEIKHASDAKAYKILDEEARAGELKPLPFPDARGGAEPVLPLSVLFGGYGATVEQQITTAGKLVFHAVGDTGNISGPGLQEKVTDKMLADFSDDAADQPRFFLHLGDVVYSFGEAEYYYDQFYDAYRNYPAPIVALAGNHDGMVAPYSNARTLEAFLTNFCAESFVHTPEAGGLDRTAQIQPGVYYTLETPLLRVLVLYSNALEDPGVISSQNGKFPEISDVQLTYLKTALERVAKEKFAGALIIAHHHPPYTTAGASGHGSSTTMRQEIDAICRQTKVWPHAVLSGHVHNYQRFTRSHGAMEIPYIIAGGGGHCRPQSLTRKGEPPLRTPLPIQTDDDSDQLVLENYDQTDNGYLRIVVTAAQLRIEYHPSDDGANSKTPDDSVTVDLATRRIVRFQA